MVAAITFAAVIDSCEVAVCIVVVASLKQIFVTLDNAMCLQATLFVLQVLAEQQTLLALLLATGAELVRGQA